MARGSTENRLDRLERLQGLLKSGDLTTYSDLAGVLGTSVRSLARDIALLRANGVPIETDRGRGGGLRLQQRWSVGRIHLSEEEAIDVLLSMAIAEKMDLPLMLNRLGAVRQKLAAAYAENRQQRIRSLRKRVLVGAPASARVLSSYLRPPPETLADVKMAFFNMRALQIAYVDESGKMSARVVEPQFLYLNMPVWYLLAWDRLREDVRFFRVDRLRSVAVMETGFRARDPAPFLRAAERAAKSL